MSEILPDKEKLNRLIARYQENRETFPKIAIFVIAYQSGEKLRQTLERIPQPLIQTICEIFVIDDFSKDNTYDIGKSLEKQAEWKKKLRVFKNPVNHGYGGNQKVGYRYAVERGFDFVVMLHGDTQYAPEFLPDLIYPVVFQKKKIVFGSRMIQKRESLKGGMPLYKFFGNIILSSFANIVLNMNLSEFHSGYRLYSCETLKKIPFEDNTDDFHFDTQIIIQCKTIGEKIHEVPIPTYYGTEICHVNGIKYALDVVSECILFRLHQLHLIRKNRYIIHTDCEYTLKTNPYCSHQQIADMVPEKTKVLDIGSGKGFFAELLQRKEIEVVGIDTLPRESVLPAIKEYYSVNLDDIERLPFNREFDVVVAADVIEHLINGQSVLRELRRYIKTDGKLIASTGNIAIWFYRLSLLLGRFQYGDRGILDKTHVKLYTKKTWEHLIVSAGYSVCRSKYTPIPFELIFPPTLRWLSDFITRCYYILVRLWPAMFAYQIIVEASIKSPDLAQNESQIDLEMAKILSDNNDL